MCLCFIMISPEHLKRACLQVLCVCVCMWQMIYLLCAHMRMNGPIIPEWCSLQTIIKALESKDCIRHMEASACPSVKGLCWRICQELMLLIGLLGNLLSFLFRRACQILSVCVGANHTCILSHTENSCVYFSELHYCILIKPR